MDPKNKAATSKIPDKSKKAQRKHHPTYNFKNKYTDFKTDNKKYDTTNLDKIDCIVTCWWYQWRKVDTRKLKYQTDIIQTPIAMCKERNAYLKY